MQNGTTFNTSTNGPTCTFTDVKPVPTDVLQMGPYTFTTEELVSAHNTVMKLREINSRTSYDQQYQVILNAINAALMDLTKNKLKNK